MKRLALLLFFFLSVYLLKAEDTPSSSWGVKGSVTLQHSFNQRYLPYIYAPQFSILKSNNNGNSWHEMGVNAFSFRNTTDGFYANYTVFDTRLELLHSYNQMITSFKDGSLLLYGIVGTQPYFRRYIYHPTISTTFDIRSTAIGLTGHIGVGNRIKCRKHSFVDLELTTSPIQAGFYTQRYADPSLPVQQQRYTQFNFDAQLNNLSFKVGVGFMIG